MDCIPTDTATCCQLIVQGHNLTELAQAWFEKKAVANLWAFRNAYSQVNSHVQQAKRSFEIPRRQGGQS